MSGDSMELEQLPSEKIQSLATGPFSSSLSALSSSSKPLPCNKDFHFFYNFNEFKLPVSNVAKKSQSLLESIGAATGIWGDKPVIYPKGTEVDGDDAFDWLVNINDEIYERFDVSIDEFQRLRKKEEETGRSCTSEDVDDGFQLVYGKKKKKTVRDSMSKRDEIDSSSRASVRKAAVTSTGKAKVPYHIPTIRKPQEEYRIIVNNESIPFDHVWLQRSDDGQRLIHPLENLSVENFVDKDMDVDPIEPPSIEATPFKLVEEVKDLREMAAKLKNANEIAVDLEHNQYRSFQGLTCLMQISTRTEDFIVDTLKLKVHIGPHLREIFKDPAKKKVMHGADRDVVWLQRDFGIYICNLFDTGQASRVLKLERNSLEYLLQSFCGVTANKEYQNADWRLRPLPNVMIRYAREDTHYLLYIYDIMKRKLQSMPKEPDNSDAPLVEVYKRSYDICMQLYEKEQLTETSYLHIYGLQEAGFNAQQLAVVSGLLKWRDLVARSEDESTGYILPNKTVLEIAKLMPRTEGSLLNLLKMRHPFVQRNISMVMNIIKRSARNKHAFEAAAQQLEEKHLSGEFSRHKKGAKGLEGETELNEKTEDTAILSNCLNEGVVTPQVQLEVSESRSSDTRPLEQSVKNVMSTSTRDSITTDSSIGKETAVSVIPAPKADVGATVQLLKKPSRGIGALLGSNSSKRKIDGTKKVKEESKPEQMRYSVNLQFHSFSGEQLSRPETKEQSKAVETSQVEASLPVAAAASRSDLRDVITIESSDDEIFESGSAEKAEVFKSGNTAEEEEEEEEPASLSDLSTSFEKCLHNTEGKGEKGGEEGEGVAEFKAFDYEAARKQVRFGVDSKRETKSAGKKESYGVSKKATGGSKKGGGDRKDDAAADDDDGSAGEFRPGGRRQAFPASGNRSATFRF